MKKKFLFIIIILVVLLLLLVPIPKKLKDGGTIVYDAILYDVYDIHSITLDGNGYMEGIVIKFLGVTIYDNLLIY